MKFGINLEDIYINNNRNQDLHDWSFLKELYTKHVYVYNKVVIYLISEPNAAGFEGKENSAKDKHSFLIHYLNSFASKYTWPTNMTIAERSEALIENPGGMLKKAIKLPPSL